MSRKQADREFDWQTGRDLERKDAEIARLRAVILNIQAMAEYGNRIDNAKLATMCRHALIR